MESKHPHARWLLRYKNSIVHVPVLLRISRPLVPGRAFKAPTGSQRDGPSQGRKYHEIRASNASEA